MPANDGKLNPQLGLGPGAGGTFPSIDEQNSDFFTLDGSEEFDILVYDATTERYVRSDILRQGEADQILVKQSNTPGDIAWKSLIDQGIFNLAQINIDVPYVKDSNTQFTYEDANFTNVFITDRRIAFQVGIAVITGTVVSSVFAANDTVITVTMDGGSLPATADIVAIIGSTSKWAVTAVPEAGGETINIIKSFAKTDTTTWLATCSNFVLRSVDAGDTWTKYECFNTGNITALHFHENHDRWYIGTSDGNIRYSENDGLTWISSGINKPTGQSNKIDYIAGGYPTAVGISATYIYIGLNSTSYPDGAYSTNSGSTWTNQSSNNIYPWGATFNENDNYLYLLPSKVGSTSYWNDLYRMTSAAGHGVVATDVLPASSNFKAMAFTNDSCFFIVDEAGTDRIWHVDDGTPITTDAWTQRDVGFGNTTINDLTFSEAFQVGLAVGDLGKISYTPDGGLTWFPVANGFAADNIETVHWDANDLIFLAGGQNGQIARSLTGIV